MPRLSRLFGVLLFCLCMMSAPAQAYEGFVGPTGLLGYEKGKVYEGYTLICPVQSTRTYLIDMQGRLVHHWDSQYNAGLHAVLLPNGNLLRAGMLPKPVTGIGGVGGIIEELDWDGKVVWSYRMFDDNTIQHHTFDRMPNGNTLILGWERKTNDEVKAKGRTRNFVPAEGFAYAGITSKDFWIDFIREVNPQGETVWEWHLWDHIGTGPDELDINYILPSPVGGRGTGYDTGDWSHFNTCQYVPEKDLIVTNSRNFSEFYFIDKKSGKITYRWGNPSAYKTGVAPSFYDKGSQIMFGSHCASMQPDGKVVVFDNSSENPERRASQIFEVDPQTGQVVWQYTAKLSHSFYSDRQGAVQKLPNGNYLVTSTHNGHLFEVTPAKEIVWEYLNPVFAGGRLACVTREATDARGPDILTNFVHRAYRYGPDHPGLKGRKFDKFLPFTEQCPSFMEFIQKSDKAKLPAFKK